MRKKVSVGRIWLSQSLLLSAASPPQVLQVFVLLHAPEKCKAWGQLCQISDVQSLLFRQMCNFSHFEGLSDCILPQLPVKPFSEVNTGYAIIIRQKKDEQPISVSPAMLLLNGHGAGLLWQTPLPATQQVMNALLNAKEQFSVVNASPFICFCLIFCFKNKKCSLG